MLLFLKFDVELLSTCSSEGVLLVRALLVLRAQTSFFGPDVRTSGIYENPGWPADRIKRTQSDIVSISIQRGTKEVSSTGVGLDWCITII